jgi:hypothetical protein
MVDQTTSRTPVTSGDARRMIERASALVRQGDIVAARLLLERAGSGSDGAALFALAETYDPNVLARLGVRGGVTADPERARLLYQQARDVGAIGAQARINSLP